MAGPAIAVPGGEGGTGQVFTHLFVVVVPNATEVGARARHVRLDVVLMNGQAMTMGHLVISQSQFTAFATYAAVVVQSDFAGEIVGQRSVEYLQRYLQHLVEALARNGDRALVNTGRCVAGHIDVNPQALPLLTQNQIATIGDVEGLSVAAARVDGHQGVGVPSPAKVVGSRGGVLVGRVPRHVQIPLLEYTNVLVRPDEAGAGQIAASNRQLPGRGADLQLIGNHLVARGAQ